MTLVCLGYRAGFGRAAAERGLPVHFVVEKIKAGMASSPHTLVADLADVTEVLRAVDHAVGRSARAVVTGHEQAVTSAAVVRAALDLPGDRDLATCLRFRDKHIQKSSLPPFIPRALCRYVPSRVPQFAELADELGSPLVIKPADGHGSARTAAISSQADLDTYLETSPIRSDVGTVVESFVRGREIHVDGVFLSGAVAWATVSAYLEPLIGWATGGSVGDAPIGSSDVALSQEAIRFAGEVLTALAAPDTTFHLEAFVDPDGGLVLGEVASRMAGALTPEILQRTYGLDLYGASVDIALGRAPTLPAHGTDPEELFGWVFLTRRPGTTMSEELLRERFDLVECQFPPESQGRLGSYGRWGHAIVSAPDHTELVDELRAVAEFCGGVR